MRSVTIWAAALAALLSVNALRAHHSIGMFDIATPIWIRGTVARYEPVNPHAIIALDGKTENGRVQRWIVEGPAANRLKRMNVDADFLRVGDVIEVCGFGFKADVLARRSPPDTAGLSRPSMHGHVLIKPDGQMRLFGPYGKLDNCIRPSDAIETWIDFLNTDPLAREVWCLGRTFVKTASIAPRDVVDEINRLMAKPCD